METVFFFPVLGQQYTYRQDVNLKLKPSLCPDFKAHILRLLVPITFYIKAVYQLYYLLF